MPLAIPALVVVATWLCLRRHARGSHISGTLALLLIAGLGVLSLLAIAYVVGVLVLPVALLLLGAARSTPPPRAATSRPRRTVTTPARV